VRNHKPNVADQRSQELQAKAAATQQADEQLRPRREYQDQHYRQLLDSAVGGVRSGRHSPFFNLP
jgi:hypothetical protein